MIQQDREIAKELKTRLSEVVNLLYFRVLVSMASGDADEYSNMDVFIEVESTDKELNKKVDIITLNFLKNIRSKTIKAAINKGVMYA